MCSSDLSVFFYIGEELVNNVVLISVVKQSDSVICMYTFFFLFFSIMVYPRTLNIVPCAIQQDHVVYPFYM